MSHYFIVEFRISVALLFWSERSVNDVGGVLMFPSIIVFLSISPFMSISMFHVFRCSYIEFW